jgi:hypothetical protein
MPCSTVSFVLGGLLPPYNAVFDAGGLEQCNVRALNRGLRRELHLSRQPPGYIVPIELVRGRQYGIVPSERWPRLRVLP